MFNATNKTLFRKVLWNVGIIGAGSAALIYYEKSQREVVPKQIQKLVHEAVALEHEAHGRRDESVLARRKWQEAAIAAKANNLSPTVKFNTSFFLACNLDEAGKSVEAEREFEVARAAFPPNFDFQSLNYNTRDRVAVCIDRLAQREQDRKNYVRALQMYVEALEVLASPEEVQNTDERFLSRPAHVMSAAGLLNNMTTLFMEVGLTESAARSEATSKKLKALALNHVPDPQTNTKTASVGLTEAHA